MMRLLQRLLSGLGAPRHRRPAASIARHVRPEVEAMEDRLLLSAAHLAHHKAHHPPHVGHHQTSLFRLPIGVAPSTIVSLRPLTGTGFLGTPVISPLGSGLTTGGASQQVGVIHQGLSTTTSQTLAVTDPDGLTSVYLLRNGVLEEAWKEPPGSGAETLAALAGVLLGATVVGPSQVKLGPAFDLTADVSEGPSGAEVSKISAGTDTNGYPMVVVLYSDGNAYEYSDHVLTADGTDGGLLPLGGGVWTWLRPSFGNSGVVSTTGGPGITGDSGIDLGSILPTFDYPTSPTDMPAPSADMGGGIVRDIAAGVHNNIGLVSTSGDLTQVSWVNNRPASFLINLPGPEVQWAATLHTTAQINQIKAGTNLLDVVFGFDGAAWSWSPGTGWNFIADNVKQVGAGAGVSDYLLTDGSLYQYQQPSNPAQHGPSTQLWTGVQDFTIAPDTNITDVHFPGSSALAIRPNNGGVFSPDFGAPDPVQDVFAGIGGTSVVLFSTGEVKIFNPALSPNGSAVAFV